MEYKRTTMVRSSAAFNVWNYEGNNKKFVPHQNSSLNKRDDNTVKIKGHNIILNNIGTN